MGEMASGAVAFADRRLQVKTVAAVRQLLQ
jgi:hypothetical protein